MKNPALGSKRTKRFHPNRRSNTKDRMMTTPQLTMRRGSQAACEATCCDFLLGLGERLFALIAHPRWWDLSQLRLASRAQL